MAAEDAGFSAIWLSDQLTGVVSGGAWCLECWTMLAAIAARTERIMLGPLVLNPANRDPGTLAVAIATLQGLSHGRLLLGVGTGSGRAARYSQDQIALGRVPAGDAERREELIESLRKMRSVWADKESGFFPLHPVPPVIVGAFGFKVAALAAEHADGIAIPLDGYIVRPVPMEDLVGATRTRREALAGPPLIVSVHAEPSSDFREERWLPGSLVRERLRAVGADRLILQSLPDAGVIRGAAPALFDEQ